MIATSSEYRQSGGGPRTPVAILTVRDTGHGMPPETVAQTFEPFFTTKPIGQGTGLGLSVVQGIVVQAGGEIAVETGVGRGTTFTISLPLAAAGPVVDSSVPFNLTSSGGETILIAEDEEDLREMVTLALERHGYRVLSAANGADALALVDAGEHIDLLLSDMVMPGQISGLQLRDMLRARIPGLRVLMMSGYSSELPPGDGAAQSVPFLQKPFGLHTLSVRIRELLDGEPDRDGPGPAIDRDVTRNPVS